MKPQLETELRLRDWVVKSCAVLGVQCRPDHLIADLWFPVYFPHFGGINGMVVASIERSFIAPPAIYISRVNTQLYSGNALSELKEAFTDWGWYGPTELCPYWYTGFKYAWAQQGVGP